MGFSVASLRPTLGGSDSTVFCLFQVSYIQLWSGLGAANIARSPPDGSFRPRIDHLNATLVH